MLTDADIKKLENRFEEKFATKEDLESSEERISVLIRDAMGQMEKIYSEVHEMRIEHVTHLPRHADLEENNREYGKRLDQIESTPTIAHELKSKIK